MAAIDPRRTLVPGGEAEGVRWTWSWRVPLWTTGGLDCCRATAPPCRRPWARRCSWLALEPAAFIMTRKMLLGIKRRAETLAAETSETTRDAA